MAPPSFPSVAPESCSRPNFSGDRNRGRHSRDRERKRRDSDQERDYRHGRERDHDLRYDRERDYRSRDRERDYGRSRDSDRERDSRHGWGRERDYSHRNDREQDYRYRGRRDRDYSSWTDPSGRDSRHRRDYEWRDRSHSPSPSSSTRGDDRHDDRRAPGRDHRRARGRDHRRQDKMYVQTVGQMVFGYSIEISRDDQDLDVSEKIIKSMPFLADYGFVLRLGLKGDDEELSPTLKLEVLLRGEYYADKVKTDPQGHICLFAHLLHVPQREKTFARDGVPPLSTRIREGTPNSSVNYRHPPAEVKENIFAAFETLELRSKPGVLWRRGHATGQSGTYLSQADIRDLVVCLLQDAIASAGLEDEIVACFLPAVGVFSLGENVWLVTTKDGLRPIGIFAVKMPSPSSLPSPILEEPRVHGQIFDHLMLLKSYFGVQPVFGLVTTYESSRIYWLPESNELAAATERRAAVEVTEHVAVLEADTNEEESEAAPSRRGSFRPPGIRIKDEVARSLMCSPVIRWNDPGFSKLMGTLMLKMSYATRPALPRKQATVLDSSRPYVWLREHEWGWCHATFPNRSSSRLLGPAKQPPPHRQQGAFSSASSFSSSSSPFPSSSSSSSSSSSASSSSSSSTAFLLLRDLGHGTDGRVWHACEVSGEGEEGEKDREGEGCAIKFLHQPDKEALERECGHWAQLAPGRARVAKLGGKEALLMPLVHFVPHADWTQQHYSAAKEAVANCVSKGLEHIDFKTRHVGFTSSSQVDGETIRAMLVDLARMVDVPRNDPAAILRMEQALLRSEAEES